MFPDTKKMPAYTEEAKISIKLLWNHSARTKGIFYKPDSRCDWLIFLELKWKIESEHTLL